MRVRYPQAGTANALVSLAVVPLSGARVDVDWHSDAALDGHVLEYLAHVGWSGPRPILTLLTRDQRRMEFRELDPATGTTTLVRAIIDDAWVEVLPGTPRRLNDGRLLYSVDVGETRRLWIDGEPFTPEGVLLREVIAVEKDAVIATIIPKVASVALARLGFDGAVECSAIRTGSPPVRPAAARSCLRSRIRPFRSFPPRSEPATPAWNCRRWPKCHRWCRTR